MYRNNSFAIFFQSGVPNFFKDMQKACLSYQKKS